MFNKPATDNVQVAIVGAGFGGCSTAYFLRTLVGNTLGIRIFERSDYIGGRVRCIKYNHGKELYESGGAIFTSNNKYMHMLTKKFNLNVFQIPPPDGTLFLYNGSFSPPAFLTKDVPLRLNRLRFAVKYCVDLLCFKRILDRHLKQFSRIYEKQARGEAFSSPVQMLSALSPSFEQMLTTSFGKWLDTRLKLSKKFCTEVAYGFVSNCLCSDLTVHAFAGMTASSGFGTNLYSVVGGNQQVAEKMAIEALKTNPPGLPLEVSLNTPVTKISKGSKKRYRLTYQAMDDGIEKSEEFDYVVLAFPIHEKSIIKTDPEIAQFLPKPKTYKIVDFTHFHGNLHPKMFPLPPDKLKDDGHNGITVLPSETGYEKEKGTLFKYLGRAWSTAPKEAHEKPSGCFSAFSTPNRTPHPDVEIPRKYASPGWKLINSTRWYAYPHFNWTRKENLDREIAKFVLADGLVYVNAIEELACNMELALIGGYNAALLISQNQHLLSN